MNGLFAGQRSNDVYRGIVRAFRDRSLVKRASPVATSKRADIIPPDEKETFTRRLRDFRKRVRARARQAGRQARARERKEEWTEELRSVMGERPERKRKENLEVINGLLFCKSLKDNVQIILVPRIKEKRKRNELCTIMRHGIFSAVQIFYILYFALHYRVCII